MKYCCGFAANGLDLPAKREMWSLLGRLAVDESGTTFLSSHDSHEIRSLCDEISVIARGRLVYTGATSPFVSWALVSAT